MKNGFHKERGVIMNTNKINSIEKMKKLGFEGVDADLATSLFEYGIAWLKGESETVFVYGIGMSEKEYGECYYSKFDRCSFDNDTDVFTEFDFADFDAVCQYVGTSKEDFQNLELEMKVEVLMSYYGYENIFGSSYWEGFEIMESMNLELEKYGFYVENTGGNCQWYRKDHEKGYTVIVSETSLPESMESPCKMGEYDKGDNMTSIVNFDSVTEALEKINR